MRLLCVPPPIACAISAQATTRAREIPYRSADGVRMVGHFAYDNNESGIHLRIIVAHE